MKSIFSSVFALVLGSASIAQAACPACDSAAKMTKAFHSLNYKVEADRSKGGLLALEAVKSLEEFTKLDKKDANRAKTFSSLLPLIREASPYDGESQLADILAASMKADAKLKVSYENYLKAQSKKTAANKADSCKTEQMRASVGEFTCRAESGVMGQDPNDAKMKQSAEKCVKPFNFEDCIK